MAASSAITEQDIWYVKAGLRERWHPLGHTVLYGEYETVPTRTGRRVVTSDCGASVSCRKSTRLPCRSGSPTATSKVTINICTARCLGLPVKTSST